MNHYSYIGAISLRGFLIQRTQFSGYWKVNSLTKKLIVHSFSGGCYKWKPRTVEWNPPKNNGDKSKCVKGENCCQTHCVLPVSGSHACPQLRVWILWIIIMPTHGVWTSHFYQLHRSHAVPADWAWHDFASSGLGGSRLWWGFYSAVSECVRCVVCQSQAQNISFSKAVDPPCFSLSHWCSPAL